MGDPVPPMFWFRDPGRPHADGRRSWAEALQRAGGCECGGGSSLLSSAATVRQCTTVGEASVGLRSRITLRPHCGQNCGSRATEKRA